jgi:hypothetical protein
MVSANSNANTKVYTNISEIKQTRSGGRGCPVCGSGLHKVEDKGKNNSAYFQEYENSNIENFSIILIHIPVITRRAANHFLKQPAKVMRVSKSQLVSNLFDRLVGIVEFVFRAVNQFQLNVVLRRLSGFPLYQVTKIVCG